MASSPAAKADTNSAAMAVAAISEADWGSADLTRLLRDVLSATSKADLEALSEAGDPRAQTLVGVGLLEGEEGFENSPRAAALLFASAASQGFAPGKVVLGYLYEEGAGGVARDDSMAARLYAEAASQGDAGGQLSLAEMYLGGKGGLPKDPARALQLYLQAADQGDEAAAERLEQLMSGEDPQAGKGGGPI